MEESNEDHKFWIDSKDVTSLIDALEGRIDKIYIGCKPNLHLEVSQHQVKADFYIEPTLQGYISLSTFSIHTIESNEGKKQYILLLSGEHANLKIYVDGDDE